MLRDFEVWSVNTKARIRACCYSLWIKAGVDGWAWWLAIDLLLHLCDADLGARYVLVKFSCFSVQCFAFLTRKSWHASQQLANRVRPLCYPTLRDICSGTRDKLHGPIVTCGCMLLMRFLFQRSASNLPIWLVLSILKLMWGYLKASLSLKCEQSLQQFCLTLLSERG